MSESAMPNDNASLRRVIEELKNIPKKIGEKISSGVGERVSAVRSQFNRESVINAMLPRPFASAANNVFDRFGSNNVPTSGKTTESQTSSINPNVDDVEVDALEALADHISEGFEETNENLSAILTVLDEEQDQTVQLLDINGEAFHTIETETKETNLELISVNGTILKELKQITKNTTVDQLAQKESSWESRSKHQIESSKQTSNSSTNSSETAAGGNSIFSEVLGALLAGKGIGKIGSILKGGANAISGMGRGLGKGAAALAGGAAGGFGLGKLATSGKDAFEKWKLSKSVVPEGTPKITSSGLSIAEDATKAIPEGAAKAAGGVGVKQVAKTAAKKLPVIGNLLTLGFAASEVSDVLDSNKPESDKNVEVTKIAGKTGGSLAGAAGGAALGFMVGGPVGAIVGAVAGGVLGDASGEKIGEVVGGALFGKTPEQIVKGSEISSKVVEGVPLKSELQHIDASQVKSYKLQSLTEQIEKTNAEKETLSTEKQIIPVPINNSGSKTAPQTNQSQTKTQIPGVRNNDGTIQRLLDANYAPLMN